MSSVDADSESFGLIWIIVTDPIDVNNDGHNFTSCIFTLLDVNWLSIISLVIFISIFWNSSGVVVYTLTISDVGLGLISILF